MYKGLTLNFLGLAQCNLTDFIFHLNLMSNLTFLSRKYLLKYKPSFVIKFLWFLLSDIFFSYFYVKIDFPDQKILRYVSMYHQALS